MTYASMDTFDRQASRTAKPLVATAASKTKSIVYLSPEYLVTGVCLAVIGNIIISAALNLQKYCHIERLKGRWNGVNMCCIPLWWLGILLMLLGEIGNFAAYGFAPASVVAPLGAACVISNMFIAVIFLKERLKVEDVYACGIVVLGAFLIVTFSENANQVLNNDELLESMRQPAFIIYVIMEALILFVLFLLHYKYNKNWAILFLLICCILASFTVMAAKGLSGLIQLTLHGYNQVNSAVPYVLLVLMITTAIIQVVYLNKALESYNATVIVPTNYVLFTISAILSAVIFYREMWDMDAIDIFTFLIGCVLSFVGVYLLTYDAHYYDSSTLAAPNSVQKPANVGKKRDTANECQECLRDLFICWIAEPPADSLARNANPDYDSMRLNTTSADSESQLQEIVDTQQPAPHELPAQTSKSDDDLMKDSP